MPEGKVVSINLIGNLENSIRIKAQKVLKENYGIDSHVCILGHIQRGGRPTHLDRFMASKMGYVAVRALLDGQHPIVTSYNEGRIELVPMKDCLSKKTEEDFSNIGLARALSI